MTAPPATVGEFRQRYGHLLDEASRDRDARMSRLTRCGGKAAEQAARTPKRNAQDDPPIKSAKPPKKRRKRVSMETQFVSPTLSERFESHAAHKDKRYKTVDFSPCVDYDDKSPNGLSFDIGRD